MIKKFLKKKEIIFQQESFLDRNEHFSDGIKMSNAKIVVKLSRPGKKLNYDLAYSIKEWSKTQKC